MLKGRNDPLTLGQYACTRPYFCDLPLIEHVAEQLFGRA